jgi:hypothetical protein
LPLVGFLTVEFPARGEEPGKPAQTFQSLLAPPVTIHAQLAHTCDRDFYLIALF